MRRAAAGCLFLVLLVAACGQAPDASVRTGAQGSPADPEGPVDANDATVPTLPPSAEEHAPFDADGCLQVAHDESDCEVRAEDLDSARAIPTGPDDWRVLAGFSGPHFSTELSDAIVLLADTVSTSTSGTWQAVGLVRNETTTDVAGLDVGADLLGADGSVLETVTAPSPVTGIRPGEPAPFALTGTVDAALVSDVRWHTAVTEGPHPQRDLEVTEYWTRVHGDPRPVDIPLHTDTGAERPYVVFGSVVNHGPAVAGVDVVSAWFDETGRVIAVTSTAAAPLGAATVMNQGDAWDHATVIDDPHVGPQLGSAPRATWAAGS